jgi:hypothetical protein
MGIDITTEYFVDETDGFSKAQIRAAILEHLGLDYEGSHFQITLEDHMGEESTLEVEVCASWEDKS